MTTAPRHRVSARGRTGLRSLGVLLVLAGVLAMHALGGGSHLAMAGTPQAGSRPAGSAVSGQTTPSSPMVMPGGAQADAGADPRSGSRSVPRAVVSASTVAPLGSGVEGACVAVLLGLALLAARTGTGVPRLPHPPAGLNEGHSSAALGRGPPRELLAQICVLRT